MRLPIPLLPATIVIRFERRETRWFPRRFRLRTLMAIVALVAFALAAWLEPRRRECRMWARFHANQERLFRRPVVGDRSAADMHAEIKRVYWNAAARPWVTVSPDPRFADIHPGGVNYEENKHELERFR
jgi:hypothetical protein